MRQAYDYWQDQPGSYFVDTAAAAARLRPRRPSSTGQRPRRRRRRRYDLAIAKRSPLARRFLLPRHNVPFRFPRTAAGSPKRTATDDVPAFTVRLSGPRWRGRDLQDGRVRNEEFPVRIDRSGSQHRALDELGTEETPLPPCWRPPLSFRRPIPIGRLSAWQLRQRHRERSGGCNVTRCDSADASKQRRTLRLDIRLLEPSAPVLSYNDPTAAHRRGPSVIGKHRDVKFANNNAPSTPFS